MTAAQAVGVAFEGVAEGRPEFDARYPTYLDYNATSPVAPQVLAEMEPFFSQHYGNASSSHAFGVEANAAVELARRRMAALLGCPPAEVVFTGGGSESNNLAIKGLVMRRLPAKSHVITSVVDHPAVQNTCAYIAERLGARVTSVGVDRFGMVSPHDVVDALEHETALVSIMLANNEVGTIEPLAEISSRVKAAKPDVIVHTDAAQAVGKMPVDVGRLGVDMLTVAAHKFCGPKGVGALFIRTGIQLDPVIHGSTHERGCRAGTLNVAGIVGLGMAAQIALDGMEEEEPRLRGLRDRLQARICDAVPEAVVHGHPEKRLPNTLNIAFPGLSGNDILGSASGVAASTGSACHSGSTTPSDVLVAMGVDPYVARGALRLSVGRFTTEDQIDRAADELVDAVRSLMPSTKPVA